MGRHREKYLLDTNVFVEAARRYYPLDFARPYWDGLLKFARQGRLSSCDRVLHELEKGRDELKTWAKKEFYPFFQTTETQEVLEAYAELVQWAEGQRQYANYAIDEFMREGNADSWLLALALSTEQTVVTHEVFAPEAKKRILIPNVCQEFDIPYCDTFEMLRRLDFKF